VQNCKNNDSDTDVEIEEGLVRQRPRKRVLLIQMQGRECIYKDAEIDKHGRIHVRVAFAVEH
jgi:hypothetical protein